MTTLRIQPTRSRRGLRPGLGVALMLPVVCVSLTGCFNVSSDIEALRNSLVQSVRGECEAEIEVGVGALPFALARTGLSFVEMDPEARAALEAVRGAEVGVYHFRYQPKHLNHARMLSAADDAMSARGWYRLVGVIHGRQMVGVYVPLALRSTRNVRVCAVVLDGHKMVVGSARSDLEPLLELALNQANRRFPHRL
ncbi:MAG: hypothetical protein HY735_16670 [Verrucomicrobia bacterium]|nr:hypothetical protein [Verrucomicrobiota bacterium]